jgi:hypothetical protein
MEELGEYPKTSVKEIKPFIGGNVKCFGLECENGNIIPAGVVFDVEIKNSRIPQFKKYDYITLDPFDNPKRQGETVNVKLTGLSNEPRTQYEFYNRASDLLNILRNITNKDEDVYESAINIIARGAKEDKFPLHINAHGTCSNSTWNVGNNKESIKSLSLPLEAFLLNIPGILQAVNPETPTNIKDRYSLVILEVCNPAHLEISRSTINQIRVPILYSKNDILPADNVSVPELVYPEK